MTELSAESADLRSAVGPLLAQAVAEIARIPDPGTREAAAGDFVPGELLDGLDELLAEVLDIVADAQYGVPLLSSMSLAAPTPVAVGARVRLEELGVASSGLGALTVQQAWAMEAGEPVSAVYLLCARDGVKGRQLLGFTIESLVSDGAVKDGFVTGTTEGARMVKRLTGTLPEEVDLRSVDPADAAARIVAAATRGARTGFSPTEDGLTALRIFLRASGVDDADAIVQALELGAPFPELIEELDDDDDVWTTVIEELEDHAESWLTEQGHDAERVGSAVLATGLMADFRVHYLGAGLAGWDAGDLDEFLLEWMPRKLSLEPEEIDAFPQAVADALAFLASVGLLPKRRASSLATRARRHGERFAEEMADPVNAGPAKALVDAMNADGVDLGDPETVEAWLEAFNDRPYDERDDLLGPSLDAHAAPARARGTKQKARKAQRQARRRNRRR